MRPARDKGIADVAEPSLEAEPNWDGDVSREAVKLTKIPRIFIEIQWIAEKIIFLVNHHNPMDNNNLDFFSVQWIIVIFSSSYFTGPEMMLITIIMLF